jgi:hypothetical protein
MWVFLLLVCTMALRRGVLGVESVDEADELVFLREWFTVYVVCCMYHMSR